MQTAAAAAMVLASVVDIMAAAEAAVKDQVEEVVVQDIMTILI